MRSGLAWCLRRRWSPGAMRWTRSAGRSRKSRRRWAPKGLSAVVQLDDVSECRLELFGAPQPEGLEHPLLVRARQRDQARNPTGARGRDGNQRDAAVTVFFQPLHQALGFHAVEQTGDGGVLDGRDRREPPDAQRWGACQFVLE